MFTTGSAASITWIDLSNANVINSWAVISRMWLNVKLACLVALSKCNELEDPVLLFIELSASRSDSWKAATILRTVRALERIAVMRVSDDRHNMYINKRSQSM